MRKGAHSYIEISHHVAAHYTHEDSCEDVQHIQRCPGYVNFWVRYSFHTKMTPTLGENAIVLTITVQGQVRYNSHGHRRYTEAFLPSSPCKVGATREAIR